ncbi:hypothetical protein V8C37DRAFT_419985 [Trichoderma ceciliae]
MSIAIYTILAVLLTICFGWWRPWSKTLPVGNQHPPREGWTFRVRGVPHAWDRDKLKSFLTENDSGSLAVRSLASEIHGRSQTATVSFRNAPYQLQKLPARRTWDVPLSMPSDHLSRSRTLTLDDGFLGITTLYAPPSQDHKVDLIAISGLGGHAFGSFKERHGGHMWLRDELPYSVTGERDDKPIARVMVYGYDSSLPQSDSFQNLEDLGTAFHSHLRRLAIAGAFRPIVFIAHSLGGLIIKQILISLSKSKDEEDQKLIRAVYGIAFFGVPHDGIDIRSLISMVGDGPNRFLLESIGPFSSQILSIQQREFPDALGGQGESEIVCFYETRKSPTAIQDKDGKWKMIGPAAVLVSKSSATHCRPWEDGPQYICAIDRTHSEMVKFGPEDHEYEKVIGRIESLARRALTARRRPSQPNLSQRVRNCLKSLAFEQMQNRAHDIERAIIGTCEWLLRHDTYMSWAASYRSLLWIKGKPGSGKSTLLKHVFSNQQSVPDTRDNDLVLSFFFHGRGDELQKTPLGLFRSLLHQILKQAPEALSDLVDTFEQKCKEIGDPPERWQWHPEELWRFFESSLPKILAVRPVWLFVDALDECGETDAVRLALNLKSLLESSPITAVGGLHICFSCRHYPIPPGLDGVLEICVEDENGEDISAYVRLKLSESSVRNASTILDLVTARASGIFMWARLVMERVLYLERQRAGWKRIEEEIRTTPSDMDELYLDHINRMDDKPASLKLIQWICFASRPLSLIELRWALAVDADCPHKLLQQCESAKDYEYDDDMEKRVIALSCGLAESVSSSETSIVQFIHQSAKDFFMEKGLLVLDSSSTFIDAAIGKAHFQLSRTCIRYLSMEEISDEISQLASYRREKEKAKFPMSYYTTNLFMEEMGEDFSREIGQSTRYKREKMKLDFPFLSYATTQWVTHTTQSNSRDVPQEDLLELFSWPSNVLLHLWTHAYKAMVNYLPDHPPEGTSLVHIVARYQILGALNAILQNTDQATTCIDLKDNYGQTPLWLAAANGHKIAVELLLGTGQVEVDIKDKYGRTPLSRAAANGHKGVVELLLGTGQVEVHSQDGDGNTPLSGAAENGHEVVVKLLLATGQVEIDSKDKLQHRTPLSLAAANGHKTVVELLLSTSQVEIDSKDEDGQTPLSWAATNGHKTVVELLLSTGQVEVDLKDKYGQTPLFWAAAYGHKAVVELLFSTGEIDVDSKDENGCTPLSLAAMGGHEAVVKFLLNTGQVEIDAKDEDGRTPLSRAAANGHKAVVELLLSTGQVEVDLMDKDGNTPLSLAAIDEHEAIVKLLELYSPSHSRSTSL